MRTHRVSNIIETVAFVVFLGAVARNAFLDHSFRTHSHVPSVEQPVPYPIDGMTVYISQDDRQQRNVSNVTAAGAIGVVFVATGIQRWRRRKKDGRTDEQS